MKRQQRKHKLPSIKPGKQQVIASSRAVTAMAVYMMPPSCETAQVRYVATSVSVRLAPPADSKFLMASMASPILNTTPQRLYVRYESGHLRVFRKESTASCSHTFSYYRSPKSKLALTPTSSRKLLHRGGRKGIMGKQTRFVLNTGKWLPAQSPEEECVSGS